MVVEIYKAMTDDSEREREEATRDPLINFLRAEFDRILARDAEIKATIEQAAPGALQSLRENQSAMARWGQAWNQAVLSYWRQPEPPKRARGRPPKYS